MRKKKRLLFVISSVVFSTVFTYYYFLYTNEYERGSFLKISKYQADKVFQTRLLVTEIANHLTFLVPILKNMFQWAVPYPIDYEVILQIINIFFLNIIILSIPSLMKIIGYEIRNWISLLFLIPLSWNYVIINGMIDGAGLYYPYDIPSIAFFSAGILLFHKRNWASFYLVYVLALLNRESSCFISISCFILFFRYDRRLKLIDSYRGNKEIIYHIILQAILWFASRFILSYLFRNNPGEFFEEPHSMIEFINCIFNKEKHWAMENPLWFITLFTGIWIFPLILFSKMSIMSKKFLIVGLIYLVTLYFRSNMMETRVYNELNLIIFTSFIASISFIFPKYIKRVA